MVLAAINATIGGALDLFVRMSPYLLFGLLFAGLLHLFVPLEWLFPASPHTPARRAMGLAVGLFFLDTLLMEAVGAPLLEALVKQGSLVQVSPEVLFDRAAYEALRDGVVALIQERGQMTLADLRDRFDTSRKYAQAVLEHFDRQRLTRRVGDARVLAGGLPEPPGSPGRGAA